MRTIDQLESHIESLTEERRLRYATRKQVNGIAEELDEAWAQLRMARAAQVNGSIEQIHQQARVERELEKLMTDEGKV